MVRSWLLVALAGVIVAGACKRDSTGEEYEPVTLSWTLAAGESVAYRFEARMGATVPGGPDQTEEISGYLFVDVGDDGEARMSLEAEPALVDGGSLPFDDTMSRLIFPLPEGELGRDAVDQSFVVEGFGTTTTHTQPDLEIAETLQRTGRDGDKVELSFSRTGEAIGETPLSFEIKDEGKGVFDAAAGRYRRVRRTSEIAMEGDMGGHRFAERVSLEWSLEHDAERSAARTAERERRAEPVSEEELAEYLRRRPAMVEIEDAVDRLVDAPQSAALHFHLAANPVETWRHAMALGGERARAFSSVVALRYRYGERVPDEVIAWIEGALTETPALAAAAAQIADERLRDELESLAAGQSAAAHPDVDTKRIAELAKDSLRILDVQRAGPRRLAEADEHELMEVGMALMAEGQDVRGLVPVLIDLVADAIEKAAGTPGAQAHTAQIAVQWLEGITARSFGMNIAGWRSFWDEHKDEPHCQWMVDATGQEDSALLVVHALGKLSRCQDLRRATEALARHLKTGGERARHAAAIALAEHEDPRAVPILLDALEHGDPEQRTAALVALANVHSTTLGYDPGADAASRAAAVARWRTLHRRVHGSESP